MGFSKFEELKLKVKDPNFVLPTQSRWYVFCNGKMELLNIVEIFNLFVDKKIKSNTRCRYEKHDNGCMIREDSYLIEQFQVIKRHVKEENKILIQNLKKRRKLIVEFQMKFESALTRLRDLDVMQDVLATVQVIELRPRNKEKRKIKKKVVFNLENNIVHDIHDDVHDVLHVSEKKISPDVVEGESSCSENEEVVKSESEDVHSESKSLDTESDVSSSSSDSFQGMKPYRKPVLQDVQKYKTRNYVPKPYGVQIPKCDLHFRNTNSYLKPRNSQNSRKSVTRWRKEKIYQGWYNMIIDNFCFPTKEPKISRSSYFSEDRSISPSKGVSKVFPILNLKWIPKNKC